MIVAVGLIMFIVGFSLCCMLSMANRVELEEECSKEIVKNTLALSYIEVLQTGDFEITTEEMLDSIKKVLQGSDKE